ncbi:MAG TPA: hypothetical protein VK177_03065 [Flavobacteriales bacterium]|nr:hypothetical protein [Flavobacteriales bacterium]
MKRTLIVMMISISSLSFAVYTQATHTRKTAGVTAMKIDLNRTGKPVLFYEIKSLIVP